MDSKANVTTPKCVSFSVIWSVRKLWTRTLKKMHFVERDKKKRKPGVYLLGPLTTSVPARVHPGSISLHYHYGTSHTAERSSRWDDVPEGDSHSGTKWRSRIMKSTSWWTGTGSACVMFVNPRWRRHIGLGMRWKQWNMYKSEAKSSTVVIPVSNPRPCGFSHVNIFLKKMNFDINFC